MKRHLIGSAALMIGMTTCMAGVSAEDGPALPGLESVPASSSPVPRSAPSESDSEPGWHRPSSRRGQTSSSPPATDAFDRGDAATRDPELRQAPPVRSGLERAQQAPQALPQRPTRPDPAALERYRQLQQQRQQQRPAAQDPAALERYRQQQAMQRPTQQQPPQTMRRYPQQGQPPTAQRSDLSEVQRQWNNPGRDPRTYQRAPSATPDPRRGQGPADQGAGAAPIRIRRPIRTAQIPLGRVSIAARQSADPSHPSAPPAAIRRPAHHDGRS